MTSPPAEATATATAAAADAIPSTPHLARFEFSDVGTKVLMIEWDASPSSDESKWTVTWAGQNAQARGTTQEDTAPQRRRVLYLLPPTTPVPPTITLTPPSGATVDVKPLPAIFPEGFADESGPRGVLHTIWAKRRLAELDGEIEEEMLKNAEGIALEMAQGEREFIRSTFLKTTEDAGAAPRSPRSPIGGRLGDKLKGLRLGTSASELTPTATTFSNRAPAVSAVAPPGASKGVGSLDAAMKGAPQPIEPSSRDGEDDLFALPISPRSPDMVKSPFSTLK